MRHGDISMTVKVEREKLLDTLRKNRERHAKIVKEAQEGYKTKAIEALRSKLNEFTAGKIAYLQFNLQPPLDQTKQYDTAISMLEWSKDETVELESNEFRKLVMDEWDWMNSFLQSNSMYSTEAARCLEAIGSSQED